MALLRNGNVGSSASSAAATGVLPPPPPPPPPPVDALPMPLAAPKKRMTTATPSPERNDVRHGRVGELFSARSCPTMICSAYRLRHDGEMTSLSTQP
jgi:hypothetical protein